MGDALDRARPAPKVGRGAKHDEQRELPMLPAGCPVKPLGKSGQLCYYLDEAGQMIALSPRDHGKLHIQNLFGRRGGLVHDYWPRFGAPDKATGEPKVTGWMPEKAAEILMSAAAHAGMFDPQGKVRGRGAWRDVGGELILHCGDKVYRGGLPSGMGWEDPDLIDGYVYPTAPAMPRPDPGPCDHSAGSELLNLLRCWYWERDKIDPYLLLGYIVAAPFGGALDWRPHVWVTGDSACGKSTLEKKLLQWLFEGASLRTHQATEAAIRQVLGNQTLPVFFDELEAEANNDRAQKVIALARLASSEGVIFRGGSDHRATEFTARSCFYFSSILLPAMSPQDRNRMAILELKAVPAGAREPMIDRQRILELGKQLRRRVVDQWPRYDETLSAYRSALGRSGHKGRSQDQFGTLLAFADLVLYDGGPGSSRDGDIDGSALDHWGEALAATTLAETSGNVSDSELACEFLTGCMLQLRGGDEPEPFSRLLERALGRRGAQQIDVDKARTTLENHGLRLVTPIAPVEAGKDWGARDPQLGEPIYLAIASNHEALARLFRDQNWAKGVWSQTFGRVIWHDAKFPDSPPLTAIKRVQVRFAGKGRKATLVPIGALLDAEGGE